MSNRFLAEMAEQARADLSEALDGTAQSISRKLITRAADTEESSLGRTLATEEKNTTGMRNELAKLGERPDPAAGEIKPRAGGKPPAPGENVPRAGGGDPFREQTPAKARSSCPTDPVDPATGEMVLEQRDALLPGVLDLVLERVHISGYRKGRLFGHTWASSLDQRVQVDTDGIHYFAPDGVVLHYPVPTVHGQKVLASAGARWPLSWDRASDRIVIEQTEFGTSMEFPPGPVPGAFRPLASVLDRNGNRVTFVTDSDGAPTDVYHFGGYHLKVSSIETRDGIRVSALHLVDPRGGANEVLREYRYDMGGRLVGVVDSSRAVHSFEYDAEDRITAWTNRIGYRYAYEYGPDGRVVRTGGEDGTLAGRIEYDDQARTTTFTTALGEASVYRIDEHGHVAEVIDPRGNRAATEHDRYGRILTLTDPFGGVVRIDRDERGDAARVQRQDGTVVSAIYNAQRQVLAMTDSIGGCWEYEYDERGNHLSHTDPTGAATRYVYAANGALTQVIDPLGQATTIESNPAGLPIAILDPLGARWILERDQRGRVVSITDPLGAATSTRYDGEDRRIARTYADGSSEQWRYDAAGNLIEYVDAAGGATRFEIGPFNLVIARLEPDGARHAFTHDSQLRLLEVTNPAGLAWTYTYDAAGNLTGERDFNGRTLAYRHDAAGRVVERVNGTGQSVTLERNALGRVVEQRVGDEVYASFAYDAGGQLSSARSPQAEVEFHRDRLGRITAEHVNGRTVESTYDILGRTLSRTLPGGRVSSWQYDANGAPLTLSTGGHQIAFGHDTAGRETYRWISPTFALTQDWDARDRLTALRLVAVDSPDGAQTSRLLHERSWTYRPDDTPASVTDPSDGAVRLSLDPLGRITAMSAANWSASYAYDPCGNLTHAADSRTPEDPTGGARTVRGTLLRQAGRTRYEYDAQGRLIKTIRRTLSGQEKTWTFSYDAFDRLTAATNPDNETWRYLYDPLGRRVAKERLGDDGQALEAYEFTWSGTVLVQQRHLPTRQNVAAVTSWDYEPGSYTPVAQDTRSYYLHAPQEVIDEQFHAVITDLVGTPTELATPDGQIAWRRHAGLWGKALTVPADERAACPLRFPGQYHDRETGLDYNVHRYYDPETARYLTPDPLGLIPAPNHHTYVENPLGWLDPLGLAGLWHLTHFKGQRVYQRPDLIDPGYVSPADKYGRDNLKRMKQGLAPMGPDDRPINLHHMLQTEDGPIAEVTQSMHLAQGAYKDSGSYNTLHWKAGTDIPSGIDRDAFNDWKKDYWKDRAKDFCP